MMEKSEPTLVPQWLRSNGSVSGNGTSVNTLPSSSLRSDDYGPPRVVRKNSSTNDQNLGRSSERIKSSYFRRSSSNNGSANLQTSSSFSRSQRDRDWDDHVYEFGNKDRSISGDFRRRDYSDPLGNNVSSRVERKSLRRSHSMISDQRGERWPRKVETGSETTEKISNNDVNRAPVNGLRHKVSFERDFPLLGVEEKLAASEIKRVPSPGLSPSMYSFPVAASALIGSDKWTSALAEVPGIVKSNETSLPSAKAAAPNFPTMISSVSTGLSMAETVSQGPSRVQTTPQLSAESQRQKLAIKQSRQLIPVTPTLPKALVSNPPEKTKAKIVQPHLSHSPFVGSMKPDLSKPSNIGKLQILKPVRERNGASLPAKDNLSPTSDSKPVSSVPAATQSVSGSSFVKAQVNNSGHPVAERKHVLPLQEKRPNSQSKSRNDFFSLMRKKSVPNSSITLDSEAGTVISASDKKLSEGDSEAEAATSPVQSGEVQLLSNINVVISSENGNVKASDDNSCNVHESLNSKKNGSTCNSSLFPEEEEAAFLRSLGWEENTEEGGLTDEEINAFYKDVTKYINSKPSWKILQGMPRFLLALESQIGSVAGISSGLNTSSSKLES